MGEVEGYAHKMTGRASFPGGFVGALAIAAALVASGCAELGDAWRKAGDDFEALFRASPAGPTQEEQRRARIAYERAVEARASGDPSAAAAKFREAAELGHANAAYELALAYLEGRGVAKDLDQSAMWLNRSADLGDPGAQFLVGSSLYAGIGVEPDIPRGIAFLERAAEQGHSKAQFLLGQAYVDGIGVQRNAQWAARWYGKAAIGGHAQAQYALGVMFASGLGVPKNAGRAYLWLTIADANGHENAGELREKLATRLTPAALARADAKAARYAATESIGYKDGPTVMYVQMRLRALGFDAGPVDGIAGPRTVAAIEAFQSAERLPVDGELSRVLVDELFDRATPTGT